MKDDQANAPCSAKRPIIGSVVRIRSRCQTFIANAAAILVHQGSQALATTTSADRHFAISDMLRRQNFNVSICEYASRQVVYLNAPKSRIGHRNGMAFPTNKMPSNSP